ncbi:MAG: MFS transporter [Solirubrobacterales bacterium]|nr:MFS transporter [Solirubrobacterales bacterium]
MHTRRHAGTLSRSGRPWRRALSSAALERLLIVDHCAIVGGQDKRTGGLAGRFSAAQAAFAGIFIVTGLGLLSVGATLPILPRYVSGPLGGGDLEVGIVTGAFAITGLACRPLAGHLADRRGRKRVVLVGSLLTAVSGLLLFVPAGIVGVIASRLFLGAGEGAVYTAGSAWIVDLAPPERRGRIIGLYGLAIWGGLALGPPLGELVLHASSFDWVWAVATAAPLLGALVAIRIPERFRPRHDYEYERALLAREALRPGLGLALGIVGYAAMAAFVVLHLDQRAIGHGAAVFAAFAVSVVAMRVVGGWLPDRYGSIRCAIGAALVEAAGLVVIAAADSFAAALIGAMAMGAGFSLLFPSLALLVVNRVPEERRGVAMGTFTAFFDLGMGVGGPLAGAAAALGGYSAAFALAAACALATVAVALTLRRASAGLPAPAPAPP